MRYCRSRRALLRACAMLPWMPTLAACAAQGPSASASGSSALRGPATLQEPAALPLEALAALETRMRGRLGVCAIDTGSGVQLVHRAAERFPLCSTFKAVLAAAVLARSGDTPDWLSQRVRYGPADVVSYSPISGQHAGDGMRIDEMCAATLQYSDNTAANQLMKVLGGPGAVTAFARSVGDAIFRLDRWEPDLNTAIPGDVRDTSTPAAIADTLRAVMLGDGLRPWQRQQLQQWMLGNRTGDKRIRAGVPAQWRVADKTGTGEYGTTNDIGVLWPPGRAPIVLSVYFTQPQQDVPARDEAIEQATRIVVDALS
ncbi:class A beta-lactamase [Mycetohabitans sp. B46]|uniref:class A beta-lactamase n=1 Tax=Mycetohabitans sp. B46 TaxID=2772536 RepID=UPI00307FB40C